MNRPPMDARYSGVAIAFHWGIALLVVANLALGLLETWMPAHKAIGISVLVLTVARIVWRLAHRPPPLPVDTPAWERGAAHATQWALYALLLAMPVTGWLMVSGAEKRRPLEWFGLFDIPYLPVGKAAGALGHDGHGLLGWLMLALVALHIAAALRHQLILRDSILSRMLPGTAN